MEEKIDVVYTHDDEMTPKYREVLLSYEDFLTKEEIQLLDDIVHCSYRLFSCPVIKNRKEAYKWFRGKIPQIQEITDWNVNQVNYFFEEFKCLTEGNKERIEAIKKIQDRDPFIVQEGQKLKKECEELANNVKIKKEYNEKKHSRRLELGSAEERGLIHLSDSDRVYGYSRKRKEAYYANKNNSL